jgi:hypothetical protein
MESYTYEFHVWKKAKEEGSNAGSEKLSFIPERSKTVWVNAVGIDEAEGQLKLAMGDDPFGFEDEEERLKSATLDEAVGFEDYEKELVSIRDIDVERFQV